MRTEQSEVYDKLLVIEFCVFLTRRETVTDFDFLAGLKIYFKKKITPRF